ncbi:hypothetical protein Tco_1022350, partial [Tanacetum coccineum]
MPAKDKDPIAGRLLPNHGGGGIVDGLGRVVEARGHRGSENISDQWSVEEHPTSRRSLPSNCRISYTAHASRFGCSYKEFLACNPKEYDGKGGVVVLTRCIEKMESVQDMSGCSINQKVKYIAGSLVGKALTWWNSQIRTLSREVAVTYTDRFHELARLVPHLVTPKSRKIERYIYGLAPQICGMMAAMEPMTMQKAVQISDALTDEAVRNGSIKKVEKRENEERIRVLGPSVPPATPTMHPEGLVAHASTVTTQ